MRPSRGGLPWAGALLASLFALFLLLPTVTLLVRGLNPQLLTALGSAAVLDALRVSAWTTATTVALTVVTGTPLAYLLARREFPGRTLLDALLDLPVVLPPVVAGLGLLLTFGRGGLLGPGLELAGVTLAFSPAAVVLAQLFTAAPFYLRAAKSGFAAVDRDVEAAALTDGAGRWATFRFITWPLAFPFLLEGVVLTWARALGEFGATILFAGSLQGRTRTVTLAIYSALDSDLGSALVLAALMVLMAFTVLLSVRLIAARGQRLRGS